MSILFSYVTMSNDEEGASEFFACGFPQELDDMEGCLACREYLEWIEGDATIDVHVEGFVYGEGEKNRATPEELAYMLKRLEMDPNFLTNHCREFGSHDFEIEWSEDELFGLSSSPFFWL